MADSQVYPVWAEVTRDGKTASVVVPIRPTTRTAGYAAVRPGTLPSLPLCLAFPCKQRHITSDCLSSASSRINIACAAMTVNKGASCHEILLCRIRSLGRC